MAKFSTRLIQFLIRTQFSHWSDGSIIEQRARQEKSARFFRLPKQVHSQVMAVNGISSEWLSSPTSNLGTLLYLHGGAYALGSVNSHRELIARLVIATQCNALAINYRLAPEHAFPAALEDTLSAYKWMLSQGIDPSRVVIAGDSAGGGLALAALITLRDQGMQLPAGAFCFSPWLDLTLSGDSVHKNAKLDPILSAAILQKYAAVYIHGNTASNPLISPLFGDLKKLPPIVLHSGQNEILLDDTLRFVEKATRAGVEIQWTIWDDMFHVFQLFSFLPETQKSIAQVSAFVASVIKTR